MLRWIAALLCLLPLMVDLFPSGTLRGHLGAFWAQETACLHRVTIPGLPSPALLAAIPCSSKSRAAWIAVSGRAAEVAFPLLVPVEVSRPQTFGSRAVVVSSSWFRLLNAPEFHKFLFVAYPVKFPLS